MKKFIIFLILLIPILASAQMQGDGYNFTVPDENGLTIPHTNDIAMTSDFTVEMWIRPRAIENQMSLLQKGWCGDSDFEWSIVINADSTVSFSCNDAGNCNFTSSYKVDTQILPGTCVHLAFVYTSTTIEVYFNGILQTGNWVMNSHPGVLHSSIDDINVGRYYTWGGSWDLYYDGLVDELRIWNIIRTPQEILDYHVNPLVGDETGLMVYYNFDGAPAGNGATISNNSTNTGTSLDGVIVSLNNSTPAIGAHTCFLTIEEGDGKINSSIIEGFPNPATNHVNFKISEQISDQLLFRLYDLTGKLVFEKEVKGFPFTLNLEGVESGSYVYDFKSIEGDKFFNGRLIVR